MKRRVLVMLAATALLFVAFPAVSYAQDTALVTVGFPFIAEGKTMPAGQYELQLNTDHTAFTLTASPKETGVFLTTITRLAAAEPSVGDTHIVFDKVGNTYYLSEVWLPGEDGYLVYAAKEKHTHQTVKGQKKGK
jgi:hypothetical protein